MSVSYPSCCALLKTLWTKVRNRGLKVARLPANIPRPGSMVDQIASSCDSWKKRRPPIASLGTYLNLMQEAIPPLISQQQPFRMIEYLYLRCTKHQDEANDHPLSSDHLSFAQHEHRQSGE